WMVAIVLHSHARSGLSLDLDGRDRPALARSLRTIARPGWSRSSCTRTLAPDYRSTWMVAIVLHSHARSGLSLDLDGRDRPALARSLRTIARPGWSRSSCTRTLAPDYRSTSPRMKDSSWTRPSESSICTGGDF